MENQKQIQKRIRIETSEIELLVGVAGDGRCYQLYLGQKVAPASDEFFTLPIYEGADAALKPRVNEIYSCDGMDNFFETALSVKHNSGSITTELVYVNHTQNKVDDNVTVTDIQLKDNIFPIEVHLIYTTYARENIIKQHSTIQHNEKEDIELRKYLSCELHFSAPAYYLTQYTGDWAAENTRAVAPLTVGTKIIESKFATRACMLAQPYFMVDIGEESTETHGTVLVGQVAWTGNFRSTFCVDSTSHLRVLCGINPTMATYYLKPGQLFTTPDFIYTIGFNGKGQASRNFHDWARKYALKDGMGNRMVLLNNWETTYFDFDEQKLADLMKEAKKLGVDMFLLDDGWFGNKYPRKDDHAGLGDWQPMKSKLPNGVPALVKAAKEAGVKFGLWIEPEMVNPKSELFENHPDWVTLNPDRTPYYHRNQLVLDLCNPEVQDFVFGVVDHLKTENPDIVYFKWDCNSITTNLYSKYLGEHQSHYFYEYTNGFYKVCQRIKDKYPDLEIMLCSGGGARCDYKALEYFSEYWTSDDTDPIERIYIQYNASMFFPIKATAAHVTEWNRQSSYKFRVDVAMQGKFGYDIDPGKLSPDNKTFCTNAVALYNRLKPCILDGDLYRLVSPYSGNHSATSYIAKDGKNGVVFAFDLHPRWSEKLEKVRLAGLDPNAKYLLREINMMPNTQSTFAFNEKVLPGDYLMNVGLELFSWKHLESKVIEFIKQ